jgi:hypothetical protein
MRSGFSSGRVGRLACRFIEFFILRRLCMNAVTQRFACLGPVVSLALSLSSGPVSAAQTYQYNFRAPTGFKSVYKQQHEIDVGDYAGHKVRVAEVYTDYSVLGDAAPALAEVRVKSGTTTWLSDYIAGNGSASGYTVFVMENGDKVFAKTSLTLHAKPNSEGKPSSQFLQVYVLTGGTGKFKGIQGLLRSSAVTDFKTGVSGAVTEGEYSVSD